jgi:pimeloyl-ACP methyl ester carboxylesterase
VRSTAQVLVISGTDDPTSPAAFAAQRLAYLPNAKRVLVKGAGHVTEIPCTDRLKVAFVRAGTARGLDVSSCSAAFARPAFRTSMAGFGG